jgi:hypothetical protein
VAWGRAVDSDIIMMIDLKLWLARRARRLRPRAWHSDISVTGRVDRTVDAGPGHLESVLV